MRVTIERASRKEMRDGYRWRVKVFDSPDPEAIECWESFTLCRSLPEARDQAREQRRQAHFVNGQRAAYHSTYHADESDGLDATCGGSGILNCYCGGDMCVCGNGGEVECCGCADCEGENEDDFEEYDGQDVDEGIVDAPCEYDETEAEGHDDGGRTGAGS